MTPAESPFSYIFSTTNSIFITNNKPKELPIHLSLSLSLSLSLMETILFQNTNIRYGKQKGYRKYTIWQTGFPWTLNLPLISLFFPFLWRKLFRLKEKKKKKNSFSFLLLDFPNYQTESNNFPKKFPQRESISMSFNFQKRPKIG